MFCLVCASKISMCRKALLVPDTFSSFCSSPSHTTPTIGSVTGNKEYLLCYCEDSLAAWPNHFHTQGANCCQKVGASCGGNVVSSCGCKVVKKRPPENASKHVLPRHLFF